MTYPPDTETKSHYVAHIDIQKVTKTSTKPSSVIDSKVYRETIQIVNLTIKQESLTDMIKKVQAHLELVEE